MFTVAIVGMAFIFAFLSLHHRRATRSLGRFLLSALFSVTATATLALLYGTFALAEKGGGVLLFLAIPAGIVAWITGYLLFASVRDESYYSLTVDEKIGSNTEQLDASIVALQARLAKNLAKRNSFWISAKRRVKLDRDIARVRELLQKLPQLREPLQRPETYQEDER